jgi:hypothetical protein
VGEEGFLPMRIRRLYAGVKKMTLLLYAKRATGMKIKVLHLKNNYLFINIYYFLNTVLYVYRQPVMKYSTVVYIC